MPTVEAPEELSTWERVQATRNPDTEKYTRSRSFPFGWLERLNVEWTATGRSDGDASYRIQAKESRAQGKLAEVLEPEESIDVVLSKRTPAWESYGSMNTTYVAHLWAGQVVSVHGHTVEFANAEDEPVRQADGSTYSTMTPDEALQGFELALTSARFN